MRFNRNTFLILIASIIVIASGWFFLQEDEAPPETTTFDGNFSGRVFPDVELDSLVEFSVQDNSNEVGNIFTKGEDDSWSMSAEMDEGRTIDQTEVIGSAGIFIELQAVDKFAAENGLATYGLEEPTYTLSVKTDADETYTMQVGNKNPSGTRYYVLINDEPDVYLIPSNFELDNLTKLATEPPYEPLPPTPTPVPQPEIGGNAFPNVIYTDINQFDIRNASDEFVTFTKDEEDIWSIEATFVQEGLELDTIYVDIVMQMFADLETIDGISATELEPYGLDEPQYEITADFGAFQHTLKVGDVDVSGSRYYGLINDDTETVYIFTVESIDAITQLIADPPYMPPELETDATSDTEDMSAEGGE